MSADRTPAFRMGPTRPRDLMAVGLVAAIVGYLVVRLNYGSIPPIPRLAGLAPAILGIAEAIFGHGLRQRIQVRRDEGRQDLRPPVPPLTAARAVMTAKASALAGAALGGLWVGLLAYVLPDSGVITAARSDSVSAGVGLAGSALMVFGALYLEYCCRAPEDPRDGRSSTR
ncbi:hypothetical protein ABIB25_003203 [Nakamurella sp. UYEF19]|uniref:DUF3180 domain-containing protein n=1 Tax=Nakamurella sp. UYEF19 TaxID=1756392 RepID=UPI0033922C84